MKLKEDSCIHFVGICGIGMSGLAQLFAANGFKVSGSDRALHKTENQEIVNALKSQNIYLFPQDGSFAKINKADYLIYSTAIENDNPDFAVSKDIPKIHRSQAIAAALKITQQKSIAVTGTCGKTSVSAWLAETLYNTKLDPSFLCGGLVNSFRKENCCGNYYKGNGNFFVFEADESDKSLLNYNVDYSLILNVGTDHYSKEELIDVFNQFAKNTRIGAVIEYSLISQLNPESLKHLNIKTFSTKNKNADFYLSKDKSKDDPILINSKYELKLQSKTEHHAANALSIVAFASLVGINITNVTKQINKFKGVWRRFDFAGKTKNEAKIYDDYAHNIEKIISCINAGREFSGKNGKIFAIFQPHGFGPLGFMKDELFLALEKELQTNDHFLMLPPYYAGGTSSFKPTSEAVVSEWLKKSTKNYSVYTDRNKLKDFINKNAQADDVVLIMGARDNSLSQYAKSI